MYRTTALPALFICSALAVAQEPVIEQVIVSATRVESNAAMLPLGWTRLGEDDIDLTAQVHINELMQRVPGAWISRGNGQESLTALRSPVLTGAGGCGSFFMAWDNISIRAPGFCNVNQLFDVNSLQAGAVEVIKGPGTAVYGSNAMHGVINVLTRAPAEMPEYQLTTEAGPYDYYRLRGAASETRGNHGYRVQVQGVSNGGYKDNAGFDQQKATFRHDYAGDTWQATSAIEGSNLNQETAGFVQGYKAYEDPALKRANPNPEAYRDSWSLRAYSEWTRELSAERSLSITPYLRSTDMEFLQHFLPWQAVERTGHDSLGLRLALRENGPQFSWVTGIDIDATNGYLEEEQDRPFSPNQPAGIHYDYEVDALQLAAYGQGTWALSPDWELSGGLRYESTEYDYDNLATDGDACAPEASACRFYRPADREDDFGRLSGNLGSSFRVTDLMTIYGRYARGYRAPEVSELYRLQAGQQVADLDPEELDSFELGIRGNTDSLNYDLVAFLMEKDNVIFQDADRQNVSGAQTRHRGVEATLRWQPTGRWMLGLDATWARHTYDNDVPLLGVSGSIEGNDIDTAPRWFGSARVGYDLAPALGRPAEAELEWVFLDEYYLEPTNSFSYEGHNLVNLRIRGEVVDGLTGSLRLTNLLNEEYAERADFGFGQYRYFVGQPRGLYGELTYTW